MTSFSHDQNQIKSSPLYSQIYQYASTHKLTHVLEIGTKQGQGTTQALVSGCLKNPHGSPSIFLLEPELENFKKAKDFYSGIPQIEVLPYLSRYPIIFPTKDEVKHFYHTHSTSLNAYPIDLLYKWLEGEQELVSSIKNPVSGISQIKTDHQISHFDLVILDGGEFSSQADLSMVYGASIIVLDDINAFKNFTSFHKLKNDVNYYLVFEDWHYQHGIAVFKKRILLKPGVSAVIHTLNESDNISDCLNSLDWVNEIIVVDMGSTDDTLSIASEKNAKIYPHYKTPCVDSARNFANSMVSHQWTLVLDADERVTGDLAEQLKMFAKASPADYLWIPRKNYFFGSFVEYLFPDYQARFFKSLTAFWPGNVHQHPQFKGKGFSLNPHENIAIEHYSYSTVEDFAERQLKYSKLEVQTLLARSIQIDPIELQTLYLEKLESQLLQIKSNKSSILEQTVKLLYLNGDLLTTAQLLEASGHLSKPLNKPTLSVYTYMKNAIIFDYPYQAALAAALYIADEVVITYAVDSTDSTQDILEAWAKKNSKIKLYPTTLWKDNPQIDGKVISMVAEEAMSYCTGDWLLHIQADETYKTEDLLKMKDYIGQYDAQDVHAFYFSVIHFYGKYNIRISEKGQKLGWYQKCIRLTRKGKTQHKGDAWTQTVIDGDSRQVIDVPLTIYHYGHVREKEAMRLKLSYMEQLYHKELPEDYEYCEKEAFEFDRIPKEYLIPFEGEHPIFIENKVFALPQVKKKPILLILTRHHKLKKGFGITMENLYQTRILQSQFEVHQLAWHHYGTDYIEDHVHIHGVDTEDKFGVNRLKDLLYTLSPDLVLLHADAHFFEPHMKLLELWQGPKVGWFTVDYSRITTPDNLKKIVLNCHSILTPSSHGVTQLKQSGHKKVRYLPLGVNALFKPVNDTLKIELRNKIGIPKDKFVFLMVAGMFWRKGVEYAVESFYELLTKYPDCREKAILYLHTEESELLNEYITSLGIQNYIFFSKGYDAMKSPWSTESLVQLYQSADACLLTTLGEGFGLPLLEAQAVGLPVIATDNSSVREVVKDAGLFIDNIGRVVGNTAGRMVWLRPPNITHAAKQMYTVFSSLELREKLSQNGLRNSAHFRWDRCALKLTYWLHEELNIGEKEFGESKPELIRL